MFETVVSAHRHLSDGVSLLKNSRLQKSEDCILLNRLERSDCLLTLNLKKINLGLS